MTAGAGHSTAPNGRYDAVVVGLGVMGRATAYALASRGARVLGLDRRPPGHAGGSSHGESRIIRELYYEHPLYVPLLQRAYALWAELGQQLGSPLLRMTGGLMLGPPDGHVVAGARRAALQYGLPYEDLAPSEIRARCPAFRPPEHFVGLWDPRAGYLRSDDVMAGYEALAVRAGARLVFGVEMIGWSADDAGVTVTTSDGPYRADYLIVCAGPWARQVLADCDLPLSVERQVVGWFDPGESPAAAAAVVRPRGSADGARATRDEYSVDRFPIFACEYHPGRMVYGFPRLETGVKASIFHEGETVADPDVARQSVGPDEIERLRVVLRAILPGIARAPLRAASTCLFTNTPDSRFVVGWHPDAARVLVCSPCSGHGFKFASVIAEINADLVTTGRTSFDLAPFAPTRFGRETPLELGS